jgi:hypothetical protein
MPIVPNPDVVCSVLQDGGVLFDLSTKQYYALNPSGLLAWQYLEDGGDLAALAAWLESRGTAQPGLDRFANALLKHGLAEQGAPAADAGTPEPAIAGPWTTPTVTPHGTPLSQVILSPFDPTVPIPE